MDTGSRAGGIPSRWKTRNKIWWTLRWSIRTEYWRWASSDRETRETVKTWDCSTMTVITSCSPSAADVTPTQTSHDISTPRSSRPRRCALVTIRC